MILYSVRRKGSSKGQILISIVMTYIYDWTSCIIEYHVQLNTTLYALKWIFRYSLFFFFLHSEQCRWFQANGCLYNMPFIGFNKPKPIANEGDNALRKVLLRATAGKPLSPWTPPLWSKTGQWSLQWGGWTLINIDLSLRTHTSMSYGYSARNSSTLNSYFWSKSFCPGIWK